MRRICVAMVAACPFPCSRGTPIRVRLLADSLARCGVDVHIVTYHLGEPEPPAPTLPYTVHRTPRVPTYRCLAPGPNYQKLLLADPLLVVTLRRVLARHTIDLIHAHHYEGLISALAARRRSKHPVIYDAHTLLGPELPSYGLGLPTAIKRAVGSRLDRWLPRRAEHVIAVSETIRRRLLEQGGIPAERISVVPSGAESECFVTARENRSHPSGSALLVFAGNLASYQGIDLLLQAFRKILDAQPAARLRIVSDSSFAWVESAAARLGVLSRIERVSGDFTRLPGFLAEADVALHPRTTCPGLPQKLLNYMSAGLPIVTFRGGANMLRHLESAWLVDDGDVDAFAAATLSLLADKPLAARLGAGALELVEREFSWGQAAERTLAIYEDVLESRVYPDGALHGLRHGA